MMVKLAPHEWIREVREDRSLRQSDVEDKTAAFGHRQRISQSHLSKIEKGHSPLLGLGAERMDALRRVLGVSPDEWVEGTGIQIATDAPPQPESSLPLLPPGLMEAVAQYGGKYPALRKPRVQEQLAAARRWQGVPQDADGWLEFWLVNRRFISEE